MHPVITSLVIVMISFYLFMQVMIRLNHYNKWKEKYLVDKDIVKSTQIKYIGTAFLLSTIMCTGIGSLLLALIN